MVHLLKQILEFVLNFQIYVCFNAFVVVFGRSPVDFFDQVKRDSARHPLPVWQGELYFEYHRGTYTSQALVKLRNRRAEDLMQQIEVCCLLAYEYGSHSDF